MAKIGTYLKIEDGSVALIAVEDEEEKEVAHWDGIQHIEPSYYDEGFQIKWNSGTIKIYAVKGGIKVRKDNEDTLWYETAPY